MGRGIGWGGALGGYNSVAAEWDLHLHYLIAGGGGQAARVPGLLKSGEQGKMVRVDVL